MRVYYLNTLGAARVNDRGIYDDAIFIDTPHATVSFNGNTDPSYVRRGAGRSAGKGVAKLKSGLWVAHGFGKHRGKYLALVQTKGSVTVVRDGRPDYEDTGHFGINIHRGSYNGTSSEGCQTIYPPQWESFIQLAKEQAQRLYGGTWNKAVIPYVLIDNTGQV